jgi:hypothetical protein
VEWFGTSDDGQHLRGSDSAWCMPLRRESSLHNFSSGHEVGCASRKCLITFLAPEHHGNFPHCDNSPGPFKEKICDAGRNIANPFG